MSGLSWWPIWGIIFGLSIGLQSVYSKPHKSDFRSTVGPTFSSPIRYKEHLYFLSTKGKLYRTDRELKSGKALFSTAFSTMSPLTRHKNLLIFGEGLHANKNTGLYFYDIDEEKLVAKIQVNGHIQRAPLIEGDLLYVGIGHGGLALVNLKKKKIIWQQNERGKKNFHIDSNPVIFANQVCGASVYDLIGIICLNKVNGEVSQFFKLEVKPKSELGISKGRLYGMATSANMVQMKWREKGYFYVIDLNRSKQTQWIELRGHNFFRAKKLNVDQVFLTLTTGDFLKINLRTGKKTYVGEFPEPFVSRPFTITTQKGVELCSIGVMGKFLCFTRYRKSFVISREKRYFESPVGIVHSINLVEDTESKESKDSNRRIFFPSRTGHFSYQL